jgi:hypothetical protein
MNRRRFLQLTGASLAGMALTPRRTLASGADAWKFGVMADTQWRAGAYSGGEPAACATTIIDAVNQQFIHHGVAFVIQVGDMVDVESVSGVRSLPTRAAHAIALYAAGIGFYPVRGNHEASAAAAQEIPVLFPQTLGIGSVLFGATDFESPVLRPTATDPTGVRLRGLTYSFNYRNVRCVLVDQFTRLDGSGSTNSNTLDQLDWICGRVASATSGQHAFVFSHKNLAGQNHKDGLFGSSLTSNLAARDTLISTMHSTGARLYMGGHDHMHYRSVIATRSGVHNVQQIICASNSYKFYVPTTPNEVYEAPVAHELFTLGYYIVTVDGPRVTVDYYSSSHGGDYADTNLVSPPGALRFYLRETFGYSLNGKQFVVPRGASYTPVQDSWGGTSVQVLSGWNGNQENSYTGRPLSKSVNTGWSAPASQDAAISNVLSLWGMADNLALLDSTLTGMLPDRDESRQTDAYTLALSFDPRFVRPSQLATGRVVLASRNASGRWVNAVDMNSGGKGSFRYGAWRPEYGLGTYGVDPKSSRVWAVLDHDGDFVAKLL